MELIDKDAVVAEIKERIKTYNKGYANGDDSRADALEVLLHDIDTLEVKEVDLENIAAVEWDNSIRKINGDPYNAYFLINRNYYIELTKHLFKLILKAQKGE